MAVEVVAVFPGGSPARFYWDDEPYVIARSWGPERIETGWWRGDDIRRDYFLVETNGGERFWLFRTLPDGPWFLHGMFA
jgi:protein ImuB